jgi:N-acetyl-alpha-D-glucosaminyl L-malate synthase BshA
VSENLRQETFAHFDIKREIEVIPNFIDLSRFQRQQKDHFKTAICPNGEKLIVHTSNFRRVKRIDDAVMTFYHVRQTMPVKLLLVGDGPERARIQTLCRDLEIMDDVRFLGKLDAVEEVLSVADLFLMPSENESFGLAALEAMACQVPVISSNAGGLPELNLQGVTGFLSNVGDVDSMVKNALFVLSDDQLPQFKANALDRAKQFELSTILPLYEAHYERVLHSVNSDQLSMIK